MHICTVYLFPHFWGKLDKSVQLIASPQFRGADDEPCMEMIPIGIMKDFIPLMCLRGTFNL